MKLAIATVFAAASAEKKVKNILFQRYNKFCPNRSFSSCDRPILTLEMFTNNASN